MICFFFFFIISNGLLSNNIDTVEIELKNSAMSLRKCKGFLFKKYIGNSFSYPPPHKMTANDKSFIYNQDTIFFRIVKNNKTIIFGKKLPECEAFDTIHFFKNGNLIRKEVWVQTYYLDDKGQTSVESANAVYGSGDEATWIYKSCIKKGRLKYSLTKTITAKNDDKVCFNVNKKKKNKTKLISSKCYFK